VIRTGRCSFFVKSYCAQAAGATAVIVVNNGTCETGDRGPDCVVNTNRGALAGQIDVPVIMLSAADGEAIIEALQRGETVRATFGASSEVGLELASDAFLVDPQKVDPNPRNNGAIGHLMDGMFSDGFECGDLSGWSNTMH
jgi:hypothetical protein